MGRPEGGGEHEGDADLGSNPTGKSMSRNAERPVAGMLTMVFGGRQEALLINYIGVGVQPSPTPEPLRVLIEVLDHDINLAT